MNNKNDSEPQNNDLIERLMKRIESESYEDKIIYLKNQLVMKNLFGNAYYLGINPIILYLLDDFSYIHEFNNSEIKRDQIIFTLEGKWGMKQFISPFNFMVIEKINLSQFKLNQWYAVILFNEADIENVSISKEEWNKEKNTTLTILKENVVNNPIIGQSMMDGGEKIKYLHQYLGNKEYLRLLNQIFQ
jgi:hypothetical protein